MSVNVSIDNTRSIGLTMRLGRQSRRTINNVPPNRSIVSG